MKKTPKRLTLSKETLGLVTGKSDPPKDMPQPDTVNGSTCWQAGCTINV